MNRDAQLARLRDEPNWDVAVIGGDATGRGVALTLPPAIPRRAPGRGAGRSGRRAAAGRARCGLRRGRVGTGLQGAHYLELP
jgi:hypothetical protein